jgi:hypothetical protein
LSLCFSSPPSLIRDPCADSLLMGYSSIWKFVTEIGIGTISFRKDLDPLNVISQTYDGNKSCDWSQNFWTGRFHEFVDIWRSRASNKLVKIVFMVWHRRKRAIS